MSYLTTFKKRESKLNLFQYPDDKNSFHVHSGTKVNAGSVPFKRNYFKPLLPLVFEYNALERERNCGGEWIRERGNTATTGLSSSPRLS